MAVPAEAGQNRRANPQNHGPIKVLPHGHHSIVHKGKSYFYTSGRFYKKSKGLYVVVGAPIGVVVPILPIGYVSFGIGPRRYYYFEGIYYRHGTSGYEVIDEPPEAQQALSNGSEKMIVYPADGQSKEQRDMDRYECYVWASEETHFDPSDSNSDPILGPDYRRAMSACLEARDYVVK
jgi:hypothetical protein